MKRSDGSYSFDWGALLRPSFPHGPGGRKPLSNDQQQVAAGDGCPVKHNKNLTEYNVYSQPIDPTNNMPSTANQLPAPSQSKPLSTERVVSHIPKGGTSDQQSTWTYPSPQMFYNALARKGKLGDTDETDIDNVVAMHNNMNEKTWRKICEWENVIGNSTTTPRLLKFTGRPTDLSPKAAWKHYMLGHPLPYDRHDWTILREDGTTVRYVIDYYYDESRASDEASSALPDLTDHAATPSLLVDVRPALDAPTLAWNRAVTMPLARRIFKASDFEPLPLWPSTDMKSQVKESVQVWQSIQAAAKGTAADGSDMQLTPEQAQQLAASFAQIRQTCRQASAAVDACGSESDCAKASLGLTMCMGQIVCGLQHKTLVETLSGDEEDKMEAAMQRLSECVALQSRRHAEAKEQHPKLFQ